MLSLVAQWMMTKPARYHSENDSENDSDHPWLDDLVCRVREELLCGVAIATPSPYDPVIVQSLPQPWQLIGTGNYAAVFGHPNYPEQVVKVYAPGREGWEEEVEVYRRLRSHPAFSECFYAAQFESVNGNKMPFLILKRLHGVNLYECVHRGLKIVPRVIKDIDRALDYAREQGLHPHDVHGRNVMMWQGRGLVVDVSDFLKTTDDCSAWVDLKRAYYWLYRPLVAPLKLRISYQWLNGVRKGYRVYRRMIKRLLFWQRRSN
jgi:hypothetical protein